MLLLRTNLPWGAYHCASIYAVYLVGADIGEGGVKRLKQEGWTVKSQSGSHVKLENECSVIVVVPVHGNKDLGKGLVKAIEKVTGVRLT